MCILRSQPPGKQWILEMNLSSEAYLKHCSTLPAQDISQGSLGMMLQGDGLYFCCEHPLLEATFRGCLTDSRIWSASLCQG